MIKHFMYFLLILRLYLLFIHELPHLLFMLYLVLGSPLLIQESVTFSRLWIGCCDGVRLPSQHCGLGPVVLSPDDSECEPVSR
jgi:hypothetical protein